MRLVVFVGTVNDMHESATPVNAVYACPVRAPVVSHAPTIPRGLSGHLEVAHRVGAVDFAQRPGGDKITHVPLRVRENELV